MTEVLSWRCAECGDTFTTTPSRHDPTYCECGEAMVDHEDHTVRHTISATLEE